MKVAAVLILVLALGACGQPAPPSQSGGGAPSPAASAGPALSGEGTVVSAELNQVTLDHDAVPGGLAAGRTAFRAYADALAEAPLTPGARVAFTYQMAGEEPILTRMTAR